MATRTVATSSSTLTWASTTSWVEGFVPTAADDVVFTSGSGSINLNVAGVCKSIDFTNYAAGKTITFTNNLTVSGNVNLGSGLYTQAGSNGLVINANSTLTSNGVTWSRTFTTYPTAGTTITLTLVGNWTQAYVTNFNNLGNSATTVTTINSNSFIFVAGPLGTFPVTASNLTIVNGTSSILFSSGTINMTSSSGVYQNNFTIATSGSVTFQGSFYYSTGTFTYTSGSVTSSSGAFSIGNTGVTTTINSGSLVFLSFTLPNTFVCTVVLNSNLNANTVTLGTGVLTVSGTGRLIPSTLLSLTGTQTYDTSILQSTVNVNNLTFGGGPSTVVFNGVTANVSTTLTLGAGTFSGSSIINMTGGTIVGSTGTGILKLNLNIAGNVTITGIFSYNTGTLTYVSGTVTTTSSTLSCILSTTLDTGNGTGGTHIAWNNVTLGAAAGITMTLNSNLYWVGTMTLQYIITFAGTGLLIPDNNTTTTLTFGVQNSANNYSSIFQSTLNIKNLILLSSGFVITFNGITTNINGSLTNSNGILVGTSNLNFVGTGNIQGGSNSTYYIQNNITINTGGIITFPNATFFSFVGGTFTFTSGTVVTTGSTLQCFLTGTTTTFNTGSGTGISWNIMSVSNATQTFVINSTLNINSFISGQNGSFTFSGSAGFVIGTFSQEYASYFNMTLKSGNYYRITTLFNFSTAASYSNNSFLLSSTSGSPAYLTLDYGAVSNIAYVTFTDIDASGGRTINVWNSFGITRCTNVRTYTDLQIIGS